jgi:hypothetical protein
MRELFDLFYANVSGEDVRQYSREELSIRVSVVAEFLRVNGFDVATLGSQLAGLVAEWPRPRLRELSVATDFRWFDNGPNEALLRELLGEVAADLQTPRAK